MYTFQAQALKQSSKEPSLSSIKAQLNSFTPMTKMKHYMKRKKGKQRITKLFRLRDKWIFDGIDVDIGDDG